MRLPSTQRVLISAGIIIVSIVLGWVLTILPITTIILESLNNRIYDIILVLSQNEQTEGSIDDIIVIDIDETSIAKLGQFSSWPNLFFAQAIDHISSGNPLAIGIDIFFTESDSLQELALESMVQNVSAKAGMSPHTVKQILQSKSTDNEFAIALANAGNVFLGMFAQDEVPNADSRLPDNLQAWDVLPDRYVELRYPVPPISLLSAAAYGTGFALIQKDRHGIVHDFPLFLKYDDKYYTNFSVQMCLELLGVDKVKQLHKAIALYKDNELLRKIPLDSQNRMFLKYYGSAKTFKTISFANVLTHRVPAEYFEGKLILMGSTAIGVDLHSSPLSTSYPGVEIHATAMKNIIDNDFVYFIKDEIVLCLSVLLLLIIVLVILLFNPRIAYSLYVFCFGLSLVSFYYLYNYHSISLNYSLFLLPWNLGFIGTVYYQFETHLKDKRRMRHAFEHYVSKDVVKEIIDKPDNLKLGGKKSPVSVLCSDLRDFTTICEQVDSEEVVRVINDYFNRVTPLIIKSKGMLDKYIGDAVVALYNVPIPHPDYPLDACKSAVQIIKEADKIRAEYATHPGLSAFQNGVGVTTGILIVGNIGSNDIFNYTGIGNTMNMAARLEGLNKYYGTRIIIDEETYQFVKGNFAIRKLDCVSVKGKQDCSHIYEILVDETLDKEKSDILISKYESALEHFLKGEWGKAKDMIDSLLLEFPEDNPCRYMLSRMTLNNLQPPPDYTGVWMFSEK
jgi:adenylate cyclase